MAWTSHLDDSDWQADPEASANFAATWTGSGWLADDYAAVGWYWVYLEDIGSWVNSYRPPQMRVTWTGYETLFVILLKDSTGSVIATTGDGAWTSPQTLAITWGENDLHDLESYTGADKAVYTVTNIEFGEDDPPSRPPNLTINRLRRRR
jgi:hypothetical protein